MDWACGSGEYNGFTCAGRTRRWRWAGLAAVLTFSTSVDGLRGQSLPGGVGLGTAVRQGVGESTCLALFVNPAGLADSRACARVQVARLHAIPGLTESHLAVLRRWRTRGGREFGYGSAVERLGWRTFQELAFTPGIATVMGGTRVGVSGRIERMQFAPEIPAYRTYGLSMGLARPVGATLEMGFTWWRMLDLEVSDGGRLQRTDPTRSMMAVGVAWHPDAVFRMFGEIHAQPGHDAGLALGGAVRLADVLVVELATGHAPDWASGTLRLVRERLSVEWLGRWHPDLGLTQSIGIVLEGKP